MSKTQKRASGTHNPSPYMRRFQLPSLTFKDSREYDELLSPLETESKQQLMDEKNLQLKNYFASETNVPGGSSGSGNGNFGRNHKQCNNHDFKTADAASNSKLYEDPFEGGYGKNRIIPEFRRHDNHQQPSVAVKVENSKEIPPPIPPHRPNPRQSEKYRMCKEIFELERRSREMYEILMSTTPKK